jgi:predicted nucleic acid-binding protein
MSVEVLVDTNIFVYAHVQQDAVKYERSVSVLESLAIAGTGAISAQTLAEFYVIVTSARKFRTPMTSAQALSTVLDLVDSWPVIDTTPQVVLEAMRVTQLHSLSYWDAQVWAAAKLNQIPVIYSEDGPTGAVIEGVRYVNPLAGQNLFLVQEVPSTRYGARPRRVRAPRRS